MQEVRVARLHARGRASVWWCGFGRGRVHPLEGVVAAKHGGHALCTRAEALGDAGSWLVAPLAGSAHAVKNARMA